MTPPDTAVVTEPSPIAGAMTELETPAPAPAFDFLASLGTKFDSLENPPAPAPAEEAKEEAPASTEPAQVGEDDGIPFAKEEELPASWTPEAKLKWGELRKELKEERSKAYELERKLSEVMSQDASAELERRLSEVNAKVSKYEEELAVARIERTEEYQRVVTRPLQAIMDTTAAIAEKYKVDPEAFYDAFAETDVAKQSARLGELVKDMSERDRIALYRMADDSVQVFAKSEELQKNASRALAEVEAREVASKKAAEQRLAADTRQSVRKVFELLETRLPAVEGLDLKVIQEEALKEGPVAAAPVDHQAYSMVAGVLLPKLVKALAAKEAQLKELSKQVDSIKKASPKIDSRGVDPNGQERVPAGVGFMESISRRISAL